ncbi:TetR/AcrR family transcriptional regulator [Paenibacillus whitsoniae]|uniref:TetR/AcrR family transcriptional regulator n=1 Tax=Paenibacillus whitsoniae TaxID=2496558 RepID=A0A430JKK4_9BACL|nr:TetR/AcrR family transcriptional regulator [Paenibacillus whitsoniae]RTE11562.1 TetR/AcrR family transcriptional regulator [Paenibacillus whitsoniae]
MAMNGFEKRAQLKKEKIMKATLELLQTEDAKKLKITEIAGKAGVSQVTIYNYFGSKEELIRDVFIAYIRETIDEFEAYLASEHTLKEKIEHIVFQKKKNSRTFGIATMKKLWQEDPVLAAFVKDEYMKKGIPLVVRLIEDGKKSGEISKKISTSTIVMYMNMLANQANTLLDYVDGDTNMDQLIEEMADLFFYGVSVHD